MKKTKVQKTDSNKQNKPNKLKGPKPVNVQPKAVNAYLQF